MTEGAVRLRAGRRQLTAASCSPICACTSYIERAGNAAGADLVKDYLTITRTAVERFHGAEIKVEGDGFHTVFPAASSAVMCGLAIVEAAREATEALPDRPIRVGVGIHAGEAVETPEGFIGSAVNMAARVCAAAAPGEVLVTGTVRGITRRASTLVSRPEVSSVSRMNEPVELFAVTHGASTTPRRRSVDRRWLAAIGLGASPSWPWLSLRWPFPASQRPRPPRHLSRLPNRWQLDRQRSERTRLRTSIRRFRSRSTILAGRFIGCIPTDSAFNTVTGRRGGSTWQIFH